MAIDWTKYKSFLSAQVGKPYRYGVENKIGYPAQAWDCSELIEHAFAAVGLTVPDGSINQFAACRPLQDGEAPGPGCIGFFQHPDRPVHHVGAWFDEKFVCEARGEPFNAVILRPMSKWESWPEFTGWRVPLAVDAAKGGKVC